MTIVKIALASALIAAVAAPAFAKNGTSTSNPAWNVYSKGKLVGADPDPLVRQMLQRDPPGQ
jgi:hypothetical protein